MAVLRLPPVRKVLGAILAGTLTALLAGAAPVAETSLANPEVRFTVPDRPYVLLRRGPVEAVVVDNRAVDDEVLPKHRAGYHGIASLKHERQGRNLFVPSYSGLNFEHIHDGTPQPRHVLFEPRNAPMELRHLNEWTAELYQAPTPHWGLESVMRYELLADGVLELTFECIPRKVNYQNGYLGLFWASYIDRPESLDIHFRGTPETASGAGTDWIRGVTRKHGQLATHRARGDVRSFVHDPTFPLELPFGFSNHRYAEPWFFGECRGMAFAQVFQATDQALFSQSPSGGGDGCPAWDFQWFVEKPEVGRRYQLKMRALYTPTAPREELATQIREAGRFEVTATNSAASARGLADKYSQDAGLEKDPAVLFADNFETGHLSKWDEKRRRVVPTEDRPNAGRWCVQMPMERGQNQGGDAIKWFMPGADRVYVRFYTRFSENYQYNHHFVTLLANQRKNRWSAFGKAGNKPDGTYYSSGMEPWFAWGKNPPPGEVNLYSYFMDMERDPKMDKYWGNAFFPPGPGKGSAASSHRVIPPLNRWQCWEFMIQANTSPDQADGAQAMWVDGVEVGRFTGIRWRTDPELKVNCLWLQHFGYDEGDPTKRYWKDNQSVWFDDVVVATEYIGPMKP